MAKSQRPVGMDKLSSSVRTRYVRYYVCILVEILHEDFNVWFGYVEFVIF